MRGNNEMILNSATMIEAVQEYFDKRITPKIKVTNVTTSNAGTTFNVKIVEGEKEQKNETA